MRHCRTEVRTGQTGMPNKRTSSGQTGHRRGAAAVEAALLAPLLVIVTLGAIDIGQLINVAQVQSNAARMGTRMACRNGMADATTVRESVREYVANSFPAREASEIYTAVEVTVCKEDGTEIGSDLDLIPAGDPVFVRVNIDFSAVRWLGIIDFWNVELPVTECHGRRE